VKSKIRFHFVFDFHILIIKQDAIANMRAEKKLKPIFLGYIAINQAVKNNSLKLKQVFNKIEKINFVHCKNLHP